MTVSVNAIVETKYASTTATGEYTSSGVKTIIDKFAGTNVSGAACWLQINLVPNAGSVGTANIIVQTKTLAPGETYTFPELVGHVLEAGDYMAVQAQTATSIVIRAAGRKVS